MEFWREERGERAGRDYSQGREEAFRGVGDVHLLDYAHAVIGACVCTHTCMRVPKLTTP